MKTTKSFLKLATALMFIAFVWGFIDFVKADSKGMYKKIYKPTSQTSVKANDTTDKNIKFEYFSRGSFPEGEITYTLNPNTFNVLKADSTVVDSLQTIVNASNKKDTVDVVNLLAKKVANTFTDTLTDATIVNECILIDTTKIEE